MTSDPRLTTSARQAIVATPNVYLSVASLWEIGIKVGLGKLELGVSLAYLVDELPVLKGIEVVSIAPNHILRASALPLHHRDPFDRMIVAQALEEGFTIVGSDLAFDAYGVRRIF